MVSDILCDLLSLDKIVNLNFHAAEVERLFKGPNDRVICSIIVPQLGKNGCRDEEVNVNRATR